MRVALGLIALGALLVGLGVTLNAGHRSVVSRFAIPTEPGQSAKQSFVSAAAQIHEIELEVFLEALDEDGYEAIRAKKQPSPIDLQWRVMDTAGSTVAQGDCREFLYFPRWVGTRERLVDTVLRREVHRQLWAGTIARGVGAFRADEQAEYTLHVDIGFIPEAVIAASPYMVVRQQRAIVRAQVANTNKIVSLGSIAVAAGLFLVGGIVFRRRVAAR